LKTLETKSISTKRLNSNKVEEIEKHFKGFQKCEEYKGNQDADIYNFDEIGFYIGVSIGKKILVLVDYKAVYIVDPKN
jgi:hypothetical protein